MYMLVGAQLGVVGALLVACTYEVVQQQLVCCYAWGRTLQVRVGALHISCKVVR